MSAPPRSRDASFRQARRKRPRVKRSVVLLVSASALQLLILTHGGPSTGGADQAPPTPAQFQVTCGTRV